MSIIASQFTNKQNFNILWDVLLDELQINNANHSLMGNIRTVFESNISPFLARVDQRSSLMDLNKQFLTQIVIAVKRLFPQLNQNQNIKRITITNEDVAEPYTVEDIHASRQTVFEKEVEKKKQELENFMSPPKPQSLNFADNNNNEKITEMKTLLAEKMAERERELKDELFTNYDNNINSETWLQSKETSLKNRPSTSSIDISNSGSSSRLKYLNIDDNNNISLNVTELSDKPVKKVSFSTETNSVKLNENTTNIFQKLKKNIIEPLPVVELRDTNQYVEQKSMALPNTKDDIQIKQTIAPLPVTPIQNIPIIPNHVVVKQLNEMNNKIDTLTETVDKLTTIIQNFFQTNTANATNIEDQDHVEQ